MTIDDLRAVITVLAFGAFVGVVVWAYSRARMRDFEEAARLPLQDEAFDGESPVRDAGRDQPR